MYVNLHNWDVKTCLNLPKFIPLYVKDVDLSLSQELSQLWVERDVDNSARWKYNTAHKSK